MQPHPSQKTLHQAVGFFLMTTTFGWSLAASGISSRSVSEFFASLVVSWTLPYFLGANGSGLLAVQVLGAACSIAFIATVMYKPLRSSKVAHLALSVYFFLSLFVIWIEPFLSLSGWTANAVIKWAGLGVFTFFIDIFVTGF